MNAENHVRVIALGDTGWLFVNGNYEGELDLSGLAGSGTTALFALSDGGTPPTRFKDFTVRSQRKVYGPRDGTIEHDPDSGFIGEHDTSTSMADGVIEARFFNPYAASEGNWSSGFLIRRSAGGEFHAVVVEEFGRWFHDLRTGNAESVLVEQDSPHISTGSSGSNHIRIIALGGAGSLFINGAYVDELDLSGWIEAGSVSAVGAYFQGHGIAGRSTRFEGLTMWSADGAP